MTTMTIPAEPHAVTIELAATALMVIDMQRDFLYPDGFGAFLGNDVTLLQRTIKPIQAVLAAARERGMLIIHTREGHKPDLSDCPPTKLDRWPEGTRIGDQGPMGRILIQGEKGHDIIEEVAPLAGEIVLDKPGKSSFYATDLDDILRKHGIRNLLITGVTTDVCCSATVIGANDRGYNAIVLADCVASYSPERHAATLATISAQGGIFGWVSTSQNVLAAL
ncbi:MAG TPA: isochorismatase family cysteine hydrolase [Caldilineaceae bacterium]|nr:isochorismatase family cysteine hydrolase [Caldilineaceae bacterium]